MTRSHGMMMHIMFSPLARPTARRIFTSPSLFIIRNGEHRAERGFDALSEQTALCFRRRRRFTENSSESIAESALRFESAAISHLVHPLALLYSAQCATHSSGAVIGLESHSVMTLELSSCGRWIDRQRC